MADYADAAGRKHAIEMSSGTPPPDFALDATLVESLLADQHPDLATLPVREVESQTAPLTPRWASAL